MDPTYTAIIIYSETHDLRTGTKAEIEQHIAEIVKDDPKAENDMAVYLCDGPVIVPDLRFGGVTLTIKGAPPQSPAEPPPKKLRACTTCRKEKRGERTDHTANNCAKVIEAERAVAVTP